MGNGHENSRFCAHIITEETPKRRLNGFKYGQKKEADHMTSLNSEVYYLNLITQLLIRRMRYLPEVNLCKKF